jgi:hypothetical protein
MGFSPTLTGNFAIQKIAKLPFFCAASAFPAGHAEELPAFTPRTQEALNQTRPAAVILKTKGYYVLAFRYPRH